MRLQQEVLKQGTCDILRFFAFVMGYVFNIVRYASVLVAGSKGVIKTHAYNNKPFILLWMHYKVTTKLSLMIYEIFDCLIYKVGSVNDGSFSIPSHSNYMLLSVARPFNTSICCVNLFMYAIERKH